MDRNKWKSEGAMLGEYGGWIDKKNLDELVRPWYCKVLPFPLNFYYPGKFERQAQFLIQCLYPMEDNTNDIENEVCISIQ
ncbi:PREDICTED: metaxin-1-like [Dinoponera quadriceps]|uniref:Metaxin-1-like n=1 Tax=Dinoponera quadriceps TaxID=609295 RepID=A0A6P3XXM8_DINQU|nr:PREDICTED: metaxin-1-like [Dinoponera quadriceps]